MERLKIHDNGKKQNQKKTKSKPITPHLDLRLLWGLLGELFLWCGHCQMDLQLAIPFAQLLRMLSNDMGGELAVTEKGE